MASLLLVAAVAVPTPTASLLLSSSYSQTFGHSLSLSSSTISSSTLTSSLPLIYCGRGDRKTAKGKRFAHSFGNARPRNKKKGRGPPRIPVPAVPLQTDNVEEEEVVKLDIDESLFSG